MFLETYELELVRNILMQHVPTYRVWAYGSRVHGKHVKPFSDLDLVIMTSTHSLSLINRVRLREAFTQSDLAFKVDITEWHQLDTDFQHIIKQAYETIQ
jgi:predicted nucleotidyltransferase